MQRGFQFEMTFLAKGTAATHVVFHRREEIEMKRTFTGGDGCGSVLALAVS
jgi:hypothetical protein